MVYTMTCHSWRKDNTFEKRKRRNSENTCIACKLNVLLPGVHWGQTPKAVMEKVTGLHDSGTTDIIDIKVYAVPCQIPSLLHLIVFYLEAKKYSRDSLKKSHFRSSISRLARPRTRSCPLTSSLLLHPSFLCFLPFLRPVDSYCCRAKSSSSVAMGDRETSPWKQSTINCTIWCCGCQ